MRNMLLKFRGLDSSTQKSLLAAIAVGIVSVFLVIGAIVDSFPKEDTSRSTSSVTQVKPSESSYVPEDEQGDGSTLNIPKDVQAALSETQDFINVAAIEMCKRSYGESKESIISRLTPYVLNVETSFKNFQSDELTESCSNVLGTQYSSYDSDEGIIDYKVMLTQQFVLISDKDLPEAERLRGERYLKYFLSLQKQADGSWKVTKFYEENVQ